MLQRAGNKLTLLHSGNAVLSATVDGEMRKAEPSGHGCVAIDLMPRSSLLVGVTGHWYGGPSHALAAWPASRGRVMRQRWASNDMLADRDKIGSVIEPIWLTSSGATLQLLAGVHRALDLDYSFNVPCSSNGDGASLGAPADGLLCVFPRIEMRIELCTAADVREAHVALLRRTPRPTSPQPPSLELLRAPIWSTWARYKMDVDQIKVEAFAAEIAQHRFPRSHLEIDDKWSSAYGDLDFDANKFPRPSEMVRRLRTLGFTVTVWITPFAELGSAAYAEGRALGHWLHAEDGQPAIAKWWQGDGVMLNVTSTEALAWMERRLRGLMEASGISGFKFDAGEAQFVPDGLMAEPNAYCDAWVAFAARFGGGGEVRCARRTQSAGLWLREFDKDSHWSHHNGLRALITSALHLSVVGYSFVLPDMVGGNAYSEAMLGDGSAPTPAADEHEGGEHGGGEGADRTQAHTPPTAPALSSLFYGSLPPRELYVRWCAANALLPAVQFSIAPWQYDAEATEACRAALELRASRLPLLEALAHRAIAHGEPIVRPLWWHDPHDPTCLWVDDEYLLGNATLVAPVLEAGVTSRPVYLPTGRWRERAGSQRVHQGPAWLVDFPVALGDVAVFELV